MIAHLAAFKAALEDAGLTVHVATAGTTPAYPYVLLWVGSGAPSAEQSVDPVGDFQDVLGVTIAGLTADSVYIKRSIARAALAPFAQGSTAVAGRIVWLSLSDARPVLDDKAVTLPQSTAHPLYSVDTYDLVSVPA